MTASPAFGDDYELVDVGGGDAVEIVEVPARDALGQVELVDVSARTPDQRVLHLDDLQDVEATPDDVGVLTRAEPGAQTRFEPLPAPPVLSYEHIQALASDVWLINHRLDFTPAGLQVTGTDGQRVHPRSVTHAPGRTRLDFAYPVAGVADLS